ncbi:MAG: outer membrane protein assembly factor BamD [Candidatus Zixiibacteriota bacterium]
MSLLRPRYLAALAVVLLVALLAGCGGRPALSSLSADELFSLGKQKYDAQKYRTSIEYFQKIVYDYPGETIVDTAQYYLALSYFGNEQYQLAQVEFQRLVNYYPSSVYVANAQFMGAVSQFESAPDNYGLDQTPVKEAIRQFEDFIIDYPESELIPDVKAYLNKARTRLAHKDYSAGLTYFRMGAYKSSTVYFQQVIDEYTDTEFASKALFDLGQAEFKMENYEEARQQFENFVTVYPNDPQVEEAKKKAAEAAYKSATAALDSGKPAEAKERFKYFIEKYPTDNRVGKATAYINQIGDVPVESATEQTAEGS